MSNLNSFVHAAVIDSLDKSQGSGLGELFWRRLLYIGLERTINLCDSVFEPSDVDSVLTIPRNFEDLRTLLSDTSTLDQACYDIFIRKCSLDKMMGAQAIEQVTMPTKQGFFKRVAKKTTNSIAKKFSNTVLVGCYLNRRQVLSLVYSSSFKILPFSIERTETTFVYDRNLRRSFYDKLVDYTTGSDYGEAAAQYFVFLAVFLPMDYLEGFDANFDRYSSESKEFRGLNYLVSEAWISNSEISFFAAVSCLYGAKFVCVEHNGPTIYFKDSNVELLQPISDIYLTQGWKSEDSSITKSSSWWTGYRPVSFKTKVYDCTYFAAPAYLRRSMNSDMYFFQGAGAAKYLENQLQFFSNLERTVSAKINFRISPIVKEKPYLFQSNIEELSNFNIRIDDLAVKSGREVIAKSRIVIFDYLSTGYFEL